MIIFFLYIGHNSNKKNSTNVIAQARDAISADNQDVKNELYSHVCKFTSSPFVLTFIIPIVFAIIADRKKTVMAFTP